MKTSLPRRRAFATLAITLLAATASANYSMLYAFYMFQAETWVVYVVVTVAFEAWFIGRWFEKSWLSSVAISFAANAFTAIGATCLWPCSPVPILSITTHLNPNPLGSILVPFSLMAMTSAVVEAIVWYFARGKSTRGGGPLLIRSILAHGIGVPLALCILLLPPRPYKGLEEWTTFHRLFAWDALNKPFQSFVASHDRLPNRQELVQMVEKSEPDAWTVFYAPHFDRFDTGEMRREPLKITWNEQALGKKVDFDSLPICIFRVDNPHPWELDYTGDYLRRKSIEGSGDGP